ncbi:MAG TPA: RHS repeat-associated core domain-containing protein [Ktedonobacteraceae bacterium]
MDDSLPSGRGAAPADTPCAVPLPAVPTCKSTHLWPLLACAQHVFSTRRALLISVLFLLVLFTDLIAPWPALPRSFARATQNPNPHIPAPAWLHPSGQPRKKPDLNRSSSAILPVQAPAAGIPPARAGLMKPSRLTLTPAALHFVSNDGHLRIDLAAGSLTARQVSQWGGIWLSITQVQPTSGGLGSDHLFFGSYEFQLFSMQGQPLTQLVLHHPLTLTYQLDPRQQLLIYKGQLVYALWNAVRPDPGPPSLTMQPAGLPGAVSPGQVPTLRATQVDTTGTTFRINSALTASSLSSAATSAAQIPQAAAALPASTVTFGTQAPQATWGKPQDFQVGLSSGSLSYTYPLAFPTGPGGLTPPLALNYASAGLNENHNLQAGDPWVGQGWSLDLGSISWAQENVTPNGSPTLENVWHINDANGLSGQLIPPDQAFSTIPPYNPSSPTTAQVWLTAPDSHAKVSELMFGGQPCWRAYLPGGITEEFGCTNDSRESYVASNGSVVQWSWNLDLLIDRYGNQVHVAYQTLHIGSGYVRDAVLSDVTYDDPGCHNTTSACSTWNPTVDLHFDASQSVARLQNSGCGSGTGGQYRCDAPTDLSGSGGLPVPRVLSSYVLNDLKVEVQGQLLREYLFSYTQGGPQTITDPATGQQESIAGYLNLNEIQQAGTGGTLLNAPTITLTYASEHQHYADLNSYATPQTNCSPYSDAPRDGSPTGPCYLWSQSYNTFYLSTLDNGEGWHENITWQEAHSNAWGTDTGTSYNNALQCSSSQTSTNICGTADDQNWSRMVVAGRSAVSNGVTSTWSYGYYLSTVNASIATAQPSRSCHGGCESYDWGDQNDADFADYYNGNFQSFAQVQVSNPDGSTQTDTFGATNGWGLYSSGITCFLSISCSAAPFNGSNGPVYAGKQTEEQDYDSGGHLLKQINWSLAANCPPPGVAGSQHALGGSTDPGSGQLFSELDHNNPLLVCDPRPTGQNVYLTDGVTSTITDARVVHLTTVQNYDGNGCGEGYDYGNLTARDETANDDAGIHLITETVYCPNDTLSSGIFLTNLVAKTYTQDQNGNQYGCHANLYGSNTGDLQAPSMPAVTHAEDHTSYNGTPQNCVGPINATLHTYDSSGNVITSTDPDNHPGCTSGSVQYSACATYDSVYQTHLISAVNAKNQTTTSSYDSSAAGGFGQWLTGRSDANGQSTTYQYDALGRLVGIVNPGDSAGSPTVTYTYTNTCTAGSISPCLELDTATTFLSGGPASVQKQWYDGWGNLVETQQPGPTTGMSIVTYNIYDSMDRLTIQSLPFALTTPGGYVPPDLTQARTVTAYDGLGRSLGSVSYSDATTIVQSTSVSFTVAQGVPTLASESSTAYEQTLTLDAYNHQTITYTDGLGRVRYRQIDSGTASPYSVVRTVGATYDMLGDSAVVTTYDSSGAARAISSATYDGIQELLGRNDSDQGSCANTPLPAGCSGTTDTAWKYTYDADGNPLLQTDPRNQQLATSYDALNRPLCRALSTADASSCGGSTYAVFFYDSYTNSGTPGAIFPAGCTAPTGSYASDPIGHETAETFTGAGAAGNGWRCYGYDARGRTDQNTLSVTTPDGHTLTQTTSLTYDDQNDITSQVYPDGEVLTSDYDSNGRFHSAYFGTSSTPDPVQFLVGQTSYTDNGLLASIDLGGSGPKDSTPTAILTLSQGYDGIQRAVSTSATTGSTTLFSQRRTYDNVGNVLGLTTSTLSAGGATVTENEAFCYDALSRLVWAGNTGTPTGGDHCMSAPGNNGISGYGQAYSYDDLDRPGSSSAGSYTYGESNHVHAVTALSTVPNQYAAYDAMGNMTCRNIDTTGGQTCAGSTPNGAVLTYDNEGRLASWTAPGETGASATYLYDNEGTRVLTTATQNGTPTDTIFFDTCTETLITAGTTTTTTYYAINGQRLAERVGGSTITYLVSDLLRNVVQALNDTGTAIAVQLYAPYGQMNFSWGSMPTAHNYTGQVLDSQSGLLDYTFRCYDSFSGQFVRTDTEQNNTQGMNPYAYVADNPETRQDPTGHMYTRSAAGEKQGLTSEVFATDAQASRNGTAPTLGKSGLPPVLYLYLYHHQAYNLMGSYFPGIRTELSIEAAAVSQYIDGVSPKDQNARQKYAGTLEQQRLGALISQAGGGGDAGHAGEPAGGSGSIAEGVGDQMTNAAQSFFDTGPSGGRQFAQVPNVVVKKDLNLTNPGPSEYNFYLDSEGNVFLVQKNVSITSEASLNQAATNGQVIYAGDVYASKSSVLS